MLILSKRLHSIFMLRLFNDCWAVLFFWVAIYAYQRRQWTLGTLVYSWALGIKMSLLLPLPAIGVVLFLGQGFKSALSQGFWIIRIHLLIALPFVRTNWKGYVGRAFEFSRAFLFKWTVNWRFMGEDAFLSKEFSIFLLVGHVTMLVLFIGTRWLRPAEIPLTSMVQKCLKFQDPFGRMQHAISTRISPNYILTTVLSANAIGVLFARSLHYQFFAYIAWATPFLLWRSGLHPILQYTVWAAQEWAWNIYPSTDVSSMVVVGVLALTVVVVWWGTRKDFVNPKGEGAVAKKTI
jgi:alpha-1,3-mannosyltransferase